MSTPGWYDDPQVPGLSRWWDGRAWTAHVRQGAPVAYPGQPLVNMSIFAVFAGATLWIAVWVSGHNSTATDYFAAGHSFTGRQNGIAIGGDYLSAASFLGIAGAIALNGYDGFLYSIGFLVGWVVVLVLVAEPLRNTGRYTLADVLAYRLRRGPSVPRRPSLRSW